MAEDKSKKPEQLQEDQLDEANGGKPHPQILTPWNKDFKPDRIIKTPSELK